MSTKTIILALEVPDTDTPMPADRVLAAMAYGIMNTFAGSNALPGWASPVLTLMGADAERAIAALQSARSGAVEVV